MATKSVIEIDILDEKFQTFAKEFAKFQKVLKDMPSDWKKAGTEAGKSTEQADKSLKNAKKSQDALNKSIRDGNVALKDVAYTTANIAKNMASMAFSAAKFLTFGSLVSGFGVGALAGSATNYRTEGRVSGLTTGQIRAAETVVEPYLPNAKDIISNIARIQSNLMEQYKLVGAGGSANKTVFENFFDILDKARDAVKRAGGKTDIAYATSPFLKDIIPDEAALRNIAGLSDEEYRNIRPRTEAEAARLAVSDKNSEIMQNFYTALKDAGNVIETSFITNLKTITPKLQELTTAVADTIAHFLNSKEFAIWMDKASNAIQHFVEYLTSPQAIKDFDRFVTGISNVATGLENLAKLLGFFPKTKEEEVEENQKNAITLGGSITPGTILKSGAQAIGETSQTLVSKNPLDYPLSTLKSVTDFLTTPLLSLDKVKNFFNNSKGLSLEQKNKEKAKDFIKGSKLEGVDPKLAASIQSAGFTVESGKRTLKEENDLIAGYDSKGNPITATGRPVGGAKSHHIPGEAVDVTMDSLKRILAQYTEQELKDKFNLYAPLGKRDPNHLELWDRNRTDIYVNNPAGSGLILTTASQAGTQGTAN